MLTVFPVIVGIALATVVVVRKRIVLRSRVVPLWAHLGVVSLFYILAFVLPAPFAI